MKYRLLGAHITSDGQRLEEGTEVGDDTSYPWKDVDGNDMEPTTQMEGLDDSSRDKVREIHKRLYGHGPAWERGQSDAVREARKKETEEQKKLDEGSEPVSLQQRAEREWEKDQAEFNKDRPKGEPAPMIPPRGGTPGPARQPSHTSVASTTRGGSTTPAPGPATPRPPKADEVRPSKPNEEQYPKD